MNDYIFDLFEIGIIPLFMSVFLYFLFRHSKLKQLPYWPKQIIIGIIYGLTAILATEKGVDIGGAIINVRDASPLCASLIFGGPSGIIAGIIGGIERWLAASWGAGYYTRVACSLSTVLAGLIGAFTRHYLFDEHLPDFSQTNLLVSGVEVLHMLMIFITNLNDVKMAFAYVEKCTLPMIIINSLAVSVAIFLIEAFESGENNYAQVFRRSITGQLHQKLVTAVMAGIAFSFVFNYLLQNRLSSEETRIILELNVDDAASDVLAETKRYVYLETRSIANSITEDIDQSYLQILKLQHEAAEINLVNTDGIIFNSSEEEFIGFNMAETALPAQFLRLLEDGNNRYVQQLRDDCENNKACKFVGIATDYGFLEVGFTLKQYHNLINEGIRSVSDNRHVGETGLIMVVDDKKEIISDYYDDNDQSYTFVKNIDFSKIDEFEVYHSYYGGSEVYYMCCSIEGYRIIGLIPKAEADFSRRLSIYITSFMEIIVFALLFVVIFSTIKTDVVDKVIEVKGSLAQITDGDLNTVVDVRGNDEFESLSEDVNTMVDKLKQLINEAKERIDSELRYAKEIQFSALPRVFPPYPNKDEFDIFALMEPAKEVGGDFYDLYLLNDDTLVFMVADVSGKGIPASLFMMRAKTTLKNMAEHGISIGQIFTEANNQLCEGNDADMFVTAWMGLLNLRNGELKYANAGHNRPLIRHKDGEYEYLQGPPGFVLAGMPGIQFKEQTMMLKPGDEIFLYTDGVVEATTLDQKLYGDDRLLACINCYKDKDAKTLCEAIKADVDAFYKPAEQFDDITELSLIFRHFEDESKG